MYSKTSRPENSAPGTPAPGTPPAEPTARESLKSLLDRLAGPMELSLDEGRGRVRCVGCGHRCLIPGGAVGVCQLPSNRRGVRQ